MKAPSAERFGHVTHFGSPRQRRWLRDSATYWARVALPPAARVLRLPEAPRCGCGACQARRAG
jgi:hypothetical protein